MSSARSAQFASGGAAAIFRLTPISSPYRTVAQDSLENVYVSDEQMMGALRALRADYESGYAVSVDELAHAAVFGDFVDMAQELLSKGYKDAAAVIAGSVLEGHLRQLAAKSGVATIDPSGRPLRADRLNADLVKAGAYGTLEQKQVTAWLGLRNHAAHGEYERYDTAQVSLMLQGVTDFLVRLPA